MPQKRFQPIDVDGLSEKAESLTADHETVPLPLDPREERESYDKLLEMKLRDGIDPDNLEHHRTAMRKLTARVARALPIVRRT